jgi:hypothetical protein
MEITTTAAGLKVFMPPATQVSVGQDALISVSGSYDVDIVDNDGAVICTVAVGESQYIYLTDNSTDAGAWGVIAFGATTSSANAATLAGAGLLAISTTLNQSHPTTSVSNGQTFTSAARAQVLIWNGGAGSGTLDTATTLGDNWFILFKNNGSGTFTLTCTVPDVIDGGLTKAFAPNESAFIICTGADFVTVGYGVNTSFAFTALVKPIVAGTYTLTNNEASSTIQEFVGTLTGDVIVVYPEIANLYVVSNQTVASAYTLTITTNAVGAAFAVVPPGQQATLVCDGTNFYNANTVQAGATAISLINGTVATPALNFLLETSTGLYRPAAGQLGFSILGTQRMLLSSTGIAVTGSGTFTTGITGGSF